MFQYHCLNPIANVGLDLFGENYTKTEEIKEAQAVLVRSAAMHEMSCQKDWMLLPERGQVSIISRLTNVQSRELWCSIPQERTPME